MRYTWSDGSWDSGVFVPAPYQLMHINAGLLDSFSSCCALFFLKQECAVPMLAQTVTHAGALHYGVSCFEGMKARCGSRFRCKWTE